MTDHTTERARLNRRLGLLPKELSKKLRNYRQSISSEAAIDRRGVGKVVIYSNRGSYTEGEDILHLCHEFLDQHRIPADIETVNTST
jgi:hypothetical protein